MIAGLPARPIEDEEWDAYYRTVEPTFGYHVSPTDSAYWRSVLPLERTLAVFDGDSIVATCATEPLELQVPGGCIPFGGLTFGQVLPGHRRRGLLRGLIWNGHQQASERGEYAVGGWPTETSIHARFGWGPATMTAQVSIARAHTELEAPVDYRHGIALVEERVALDRCPGIYESAQASTPGFPHRSRARWQHWLDRDPWHWQGAEWTADVGPRTFALWDGRGYVAYRLQRRIGLDGPAYRVLVAELVALDSEAYRGLWQWCFDMDLVAEIVASLRPVDEPLQLVLKDPRRLRISITDGLWMRLLDVPSALEARRYGTDGTVVLEVLDTFGPWSSGRYQLQVRDAAGECRRSASPPDVQVTIAGLSSAYLGGVSFSRLVRGGSAIELKPGTAERLDAMFVTEPKPWCPWVF